MNGADLLCDVLLTNDVDVCFANPGTSEMHFVAALDRKPQMRCVLGLAEGVVTGAADGYARMADKPAATLLHCGPGLANGLANLHNARRGRTPMVNIVGDHASYHLKYDAPLTTDIESLARPMSQWVGRVAGAEDIRARTEEAYRESLARRGVATMILPADSAWGEVVAPADLKPVAPPPTPPVDEALVVAASRALRSGRRVGIFLSGLALRATALETAGRIARATGASLHAQTSARAERGAGRVAAAPVPYKLGLALKALEDIEVAICFGEGTPVAFFAYPGKPPIKLPATCEVIHVAQHEHDLPEALKALAAALGLRADSPFTPNLFTQNEIGEPTGKLDPDSIALAVARRLPENAIVCEESITSGGKFAALAPGLHPHDHLVITGGSIGIGIPLAAGAAVACPDRKVVALQADGSGLYTVQGLWTQAREQLDVVTVVYSNGAYAILQGEMRDVGVNSFGDNARRMLDLDRPRIDWPQIARGFGVEAGRATTIEEFTKLLDAAMSRRGPFLIEACI